jgi:hypothetical protein
VPFANQTNADIEKVLKAGPPIHVKSGETSKQPVSKSKNAALAKQKEQKLRIEIVTVLDKYVLLYS